MLSVTKVTAHRYTGVNEKKGASSEVDKVKTQAGKEFTLVNLPFYYVGMLEQVLAHLKL